MLIRPASRPIRHNASVVGAKYRLTSGDLYEARAAHAGWANIAIQIFGALLIVFGIVGLTANVHSQSWLPIIIGLVLLFRLRLANLLSVRRDAAVFREQEFTACEQGVDLRTENGSGHLDWSGVLRYAETKNLFMLYPQPNVFHLIPKRALGTSELYSFRDLLDRQLGEKSAAHKNRLSARLGLLLAVIAIAITMVIWATAHRAH